jgi:hypothetical protein
MDTLDKRMQSILERGDLSTDECLKLYDQSFTRYLNVHDDYRLRPVVSRVSTSPPAVIETETNDAIEEEILENLPKTMKTKAELLVWKMKADTSIAWSEKGELKYKGETVRGSNVADLVRDVLRKRKYFNPQGWETFREALREANVPEDWNGHEDHWKYIYQTKRTPRSRKRQQSPSPIIPTPQNHQETEGKKSRTGSTFKTEVETKKGAVVNMESIYYNLSAPASYGGFSKVKPKGYTKKEVREWT